MKKILVVTMIISLMVLNFNFLSAKTDGEKELEKGIKVEKNLKVYEKLYAMDLENYADCYMDSDGVLNVMIKNNDDKTMKKINEVASEGTIAFHNAKYSLKELKAFLKKIDSKKYDMDFLNGFGISTKENKIYLDVLYLDDNVRKTVAEILNLDDVIFNVVEKSEVEVSDIISGSAVTSVTPGLVSSIGFPASNSSGTVKGIVMAGHAFDSRGGNITYGGYTAGQMISREYSTNCDASFVQTNSNVALTRTLIGTNRRIGTYTTAIPDGTEIAKYGMTTYITYGTIVDNDAYEVISGMWCYRAKANYSSSGGDSGGTVALKYSYYYDGTYYFYKLIGIHCAGGTYSYFVTYSQIQNSLGVSLY